MPSTLLDAQQITRRYGDRTILDAVDVRVDVDGRVGLVGPNGAGKSTLLRVLAGLEPPDGGTVRRFGTVGYLPQIADTSESGLTVEQMILERVGVAAANRALEHWASALAAGELEAIDAHAAALDRWLALGGDDAEARLAAALGELGLDEGFSERPVDTLSGGQASRAGLAALAVARFDVILLDEPTNHLDDDGLERLRALLDARSVGIVLVSHDRALLRDAIDEVIELDPHTGEATHFHGGWEAFERARRASQAKARAEHEQALAGRAKLVAAEREIRRRAVASATRAHARVHDNDKHSREWVTMRAEGMAARARKMSSRTQRIEIPDRPWEDRPLRLELTPDERRGPWIVALDRLVVRRGMWVLGPIDFAVRHGERILVNGPNGSGKSTLLAALAGQIRPTEGSRRAAPADVIAQLGQTHDTRPGHGTVIDHVRAATDLGEQAARTALAWFGLPSDVAQRPIATLSPGERTRAELTVVAHQRATCLLLDEPTNHLDIESLEIVEAALRDWPGGLVVVTHDRRLRRELRLDRQFAV